MRVIKIIFLFSFGAVCYPVIEILWRGHSHVSMAFTGGSVFVTLYRFYKRYQTKQLIKRCVCGSLIITFFELVSGLIVNCALMLDVWNYSKQKFNFKGQICLGYSVLWALLCIPINFICEKFSKLKI